MHTKRLFCVFLAMLMLLSLAACGQKEPDPEKCQHVWDEGTVTKPASVEAEGQKVYTCTLCGETKIEILPKADAEIPPQPVKPVATEKNDDEDTAKTDTKAESTKKGETKKEETKPAEKPKEEKKEEYNKKYVIKVNRKANVVTVYKKDSKTGEYTVPVRADYCSCGGADTPLGTFYTTSQYRWGTLIQHMYGQYCTRIVKDILFHSVPYNKKYDPSTLVPGEYNKLGKTASHGCVRLNVDAAKWIFDNCDSGTRCIIYEDADPGPMTPNKVMKIADDCGWDPTDKDANNPWLKDPNYMPWVDPNKPTEPVEDPEQPPVEETPVEPTDPPVEETPVEPTDPPVEETPVEPTDPPVEETPVEPPVEPVEPNPTTPEQPGDPGTPEEP